MNLDDARALAEAWMEHHQLSGWRFRFDRAVSRFGSCQYWMREITLSAALTELNTEADVENTILHEIAHALAGPGAGHGPKWKRVAASIGAEPKRGYDARVVRPPHKYAATCPGCGHTYSSNRARFVACGRCCRGRPFDVRYVLQWKTAA